MDAIITNIHTCVIKAYNKIITENTILISDINKIIVDYLITHESTKKYGEICMNINNMMYYFKRVFGTIENPNCENANGVLTNMMLTCVMNGCITTKLRLVICIAHREYYKKRTETVYKIMHNLGCTIKKYANHCVIKINGNKLKIVHTNRFKRDISDIDIDLFKTIDNRNFPNPQEDEIIKWTNTLRFMMKKYEKEIKEGQNNIIMNTFNNMWRIMMNFQDMSVKEDGLINETIKEITCYV